MKHMPDESLDPLLTSEAWITPSETHRAQQRWRWPARIAPALVGLLLMGLLLVSPGRVRAHEGRPVGPTIFVVGFQEEPAVEGLMNGVDLRVELPEGSDAAPELVEGLEATLKVEVTHVPSAVSRVMDLRPVFGDPGHYTADFIPTAPGEYQFHFFGTIDELAVDETFESGHDTFSEVETAQDMQFPNLVPQAREFESAVRGAQQAAGEAQDSAATATLLAVAALVLGLTGAVAGLVALVTVRRRA